MEPMGMNTLVLCILEAPLAYSREVQDEEEQKRGADLSLGCEVYRQG